MASLRVFFKYSPFVAPRKHQSILLNISRYCSTTSQQSDAVKPGECTSKPTGVVKTVNLVFVKSNGTKISTSGKVGDSLLDVVVNNHLDLDGFGACEGTLTCSTCHVILKEADFNRLPEKPTTEESDMLDLAHEISDTSRLGCQVTLSEELEGLEVRLPSTIHDARE